jgi:tetratricopeptide (TPR) repeat protein
MGYGVKTDYTTGRELDLDKTYENIILPVCKKLHLECFRAKDIAISGIVDTTMYHWIYKADVVIADISTLNANALYELGVRHALRPYSTIVISEKELKYPFDVNHTIIDPYEHLGRDIGVSEAKRFKRELEKKLRPVLSKPNTDSPVYTYLSTLQPPKLSTMRKAKKKELPYTPPSISDLVKDAESAKNRGEFELATKILSAALKYDNNNQFIIQRLALVTYKSEKPNKLSALGKALRILKKLKPDSTTDPETLGLCGAVYKRMFEETNQRKFLEAALGYYEKGFYIRQDYYNGINVAFLYDQLASLATKKNEAIHYSYHANRIRTKVIAICKVLIKKKTYASRSDAIWIAQTMYQALLGNGQKSRAQPYLKLVKKHSKGSFDKDTFKKHVDELLSFKKTVAKKYKLQFHGGC